jgi:hypothetical protein
MVGVEPLLSRRAALTTGAGVAAAALAGCGADTGTSAATDDEYDADLRLLRHAVDREQRVRAQVRAASRQQPRLRSDLRRIVDVHQAHIEVLSRSLEQRTNPTAVEKGPRLDARDTARDLARSERVLAEAHAKAALQARSGPFARVLAGLAASADQQGLVLDGLASSARRG